MNFIENYLIYMKQKKKEREEYRTINDSIENKCKHTRTHAHLNENCTGILFFSLLYFVLSSMYKDEVIQGFCRLSFVYFFYLFRHGVLSINVHQLIWFLLTTILVHWLFKSVLFRRLILSILFSKLV